MVLIPRIELGSDRYQRPVITIILYQLSFILLIKYSNNRPLIAHITERTYILKVKLKYSAKYPTITGPKIKPANPSVAKFDTVKLIGSLELLIACR